MKSRKLTAGLAIAVILSIFLTGCGAKNDPRSLAKETWELTADLMANPSRKESIEKRMAEIEAMVEKMSMPNQLIYAGEVMRLSAENAGDIFRTAFEGSEAQEALREFGESLNTPEAQESLRALNEAFGSTASEGQNEANPFSDLMNVNSTELQSALQALQGLFGQ